MTIPSWPADATLAVNIVINVEEGAQRNIDLGDDATEPMGESPLSLAPGERDLVVESQYEYGVAEGLERVLSALAEAGATATVFACGRSYEQHPDVARELATRGFDVVGHGYRWTPTLELSRDDVRADIGRTRAAVGAATGQRVDGWFSRSPAGSTSRDAAALEGMLYDSMSCADDAPFFVPVFGRPFLVVPYTTDLNDIRFWRGNLFTGDDFANYAQDALAVLSAEAASAPRLVSIGLHPRIIGRPGRIDGLRRILATLAEMPNGWLARRSDIARAWLSNYAQPDTWNWPTDEVPSPTTEMSAP